MRDAYDVRLDEGDRGVRPSRRIRYLPAAFLIRPKYRRSKYRNKRSWERVQWPADIRVRLDQIASCTDKSGTETHGPRRHACHPEQSLFALVRWPDPGPSGRLRHTDSPKSENRYSRGPHTRLYR